MARAGELVHAAHVVAVHVRRNGQHVVSELALDQVAQWPQAERCVDDEVVPPATDVPHVAPQQWMHVRLGDQGDLVIEPLGDEPRIGDRKIEHSRRLRQCSGAGPSIGSVTIAE